MHCSYQNSWVCGQQTKPTLQKCIVFGLTIKQRNTWTNLDSIFKHWEVDCKDPYFQIRKIRKYDATIPKVPNSHCQLEVIWGSVSDHTVCPWSHHSPSPHDGGVCAFTGQLFTHRLIACYSWGWNVSLKNEIQTSQLVFEDWQPCTLNNILTLCPCPYPQKLWMDSFTQQKAFCGYDCIKRFEIQTLSCILYGPRVTAKVLLRGRQEEPRSEKRCDGESRDCTYEATTQGILVASRSWNRQGTRSFLEAPGGTPVYTLIWAL